MDASEDFDAVFGEGAATYLHGSQNPGNVLEGRVVLPAAARPTTENVLEGRAENPVLTGRVMRAAENPVLEGRVMRAAENPVLEGSVVGRAENPVLTGSVVGRAEVADPFDEFNNLEENASNLPPAVDYVNALVDFLNKKRSKEGRLTSQKTKDVLIKIFNMGLDPESFLLDAWHDHDFITLLETNNDFFTSTQPEIPLNHYFRAIIQARLLAKMEKKLEAMDKQDLEDKLGKTFKERNINILQRYAEFTEKHKGGKKHRTKKMKLTVLSRRKSMKRTKTRTTRRKQILSRRNERLRKAFYRW